MKKAVSSSQFEKYFQLAQRTARVQLLKKWHTDRQAVSWQVTQNLFGLPLSNIERVALLEVTQGQENQLGYEAWVFSELPNWSQEVAATALRSWAEDTECHFWHRLVPILRIPSLPQRLSYTILDISPMFAGKQITDVILETVGWEDFSPAYHALLFDRSVQFNCVSKRLDTLAVSILQSAAPTIHPDDKSLLSAAAWLMKSSQTVKIETLIATKPDAVWKHMLASALAEHKDRKKGWDRATKLCAKSDASALKIAEELPAAWSRSDVDAQTFGLVVATLAARSWQGAGLFAGVPQALVQTSADTLPEGPWQIEFRRWLGLVPPPAESGLAAEREKMLSASGNLGQGTISNFSDDAMNLSETAVRFLGQDRAAFLACIAKRRSPASQATTSVSFWSGLTEIWTQLATSRLQDIAVESRKQTGLATLAYLATLGRLAGSDEAVLKIMDHIRSSEEDELRAIVASLGEINTPRSLLELISVITRPNATVTVQQDAASVLTKKVVSPLQTELRAAVQDLKVPADAASPIAEVRETLVNLLHTEPELDTKPETGTGTSPSSIDDKSLDASLSSMIPNYKRLSSEVCRALRTALFFNQTIAGSEATHAIDLSPLIDMQYKAMELLFREFFEEAASRALMRGDIPRKLDVIGYARPIPVKMDEFENYIANLAVVREIPFFSKFKLRKMLRAICQFQPGRRFTLDGLKAFGLFFLCFSRAQCKFGLSGLFPIGAKDDLELAEFAKELHVFQDFRNRAAHEGFHPQASNDIQGIWRSTALIVQWAFRIRESLATPSAASPVVTSHKQAS